MFDFIPLDQYSHYFHIAVFVFVMFTFILCQRGIILNKDIVNINAGLGFIVAVLIIFYIGLRPINGVFGDTANYVNGFNELSIIPLKWSWGGDFLFYNMMAWFAHHSSINVFFTVCALLYVGLLWLAMKNIFNTYYFVPFLVLICMFTFWEYGVNGIRNGIASSFFILAMTYVNNPLISLLLCVVSIGFHKSMVLIVVAAILAWFVQNPFLYLIIWLTSIPFSYLMGNRLQTLLAGFSLVRDSDDRISKYLVYTHEQMLSDGLIVEMSFRWDFLLYSALGVVVGYYFIFKRNFKDEYYHWIYNTYLLTNVFWILVIRAAYSNRFAQISWFIMPIVLVYPFMKRRFWINHEKMLGYAILAFYAFAFYQNMLK